MICVVPPPPPPPPPTPLFISHHFTASLSRLRHHMHTAHMKWLRACVVRYCVYMRVYMCAFGHDVSSHIAQNTHTQPPRVYNVHTQTQTLQTVGGCWRFSIIPMCAMFCVHHANACVWETCTRTHVGIVVVVVVAFVQNVLENFTAHRLMLTWHRRWFCINTSNTVQHANKHTQIK